MKDPSATFQTPLKPDILWQTMQDEEALPLVHCLTCVARWWEGERLLPLLMILSPIRLQTTLASIKMWTEEWNPKQRCSSGPGPYCFKLQCSCSYLCDLMGHDWSLWPRETRGSGGRPCSFSCGGKACFFYWPSSCCGDESCCVVNFAVWILQTPSGTHLYGSCMSSAVHANVLTDIKEEIKMRMT